MQMSRGEMQDLLIKFSAQNPEYRSALLRNPKGVVQEQFQMDLPEDMSIEVLEESPQKAYVVLPYMMAEGADLSDADLEAMAGGNTVKGDANCEDAIASTVVEVQASLF